MVDETFVEIPARAVSEVFLVIFDFFGQIRLLF